VNVATRGSVTDLRHDGRISGSVFVELALATTPSHPTCLEALRARVLRDALDGAPPAGTRTFRAARRPWLTLAPGVEMKLLRPDTTGCVTALVRMAPASRYEAHVHPLHEQCLVLSGEIHIGSYLLRAGDLHIADAGSSHDVTFSPCGALLFVRTSRD
jgi:quercetin dioxygenase-like cupin family protein